MEEKFGGEPQSTVDPASFFTDEAINGSDAQPSTEENNGQSNDVSNPVEQGFNGQDWKFKAAGREYIPKTKDEIIKWASMGINYDVKARKLNEERAKFLEEKSSFTQQKQTQPVQNEKIENNGSINPFLDPEVRELMTKYDEIKKELLTIRETAESANQVTSNMTQTQYDTWLDDSIVAIREELGDAFTPDVEQELYLDMQEMLDMIPEERLKTKDGIASLVRSIFFLRHPEGVDAAVQARVKSGLNQNKKNNGSRVVTEGSATGSAKGTPAPMSWEEADAGAAEMLKDIDTRF
jgi:hypothetical protein